MKWLTEGQRGPELATTVKGLLVTEQGERRQRSFTTKGRTGQHERWYVSKSVQAFGTNRAGHAVGRLAAEPLEELVLAQIRAALQTPERIQGAQDAVRAPAIGLTAPEVVLPMLHNLATVRQALCPAELQRIARLLIESVVVSADAVSIAWCDAGCAELEGEMRPGGIGAELLELEAEGAAA